MKLTFATAHRLSIRFIVLWVATCALVRTAVFADTNCVAPPAGLVSWWRAEGSGLDEVGGNDGARSGDVGYIGGRVGQGFLFDGNSDAVLVGTATNLRLQSFTIEAWVQRASPSAVTYFWDGGAQLFGGGSGSYNLAMGSDGQLFLGKVDIALVQAGAAITDTDFHHVAVTKAGSAVVFYIDGVSYPAAAFNPTFTFSSGFAIGARADNQGNSFLGKIDELAVYDRALTATEVQAIYGAGSSGKCTTGVPPSIFTQPTNQTVFAGDTAVFAVVASGTTPLSYQWLFNGTEIPSATQSTLVLAGVVPAQAGDYAVQVTNTFGAVTSSIAVLTVSPAPPCVVPPQGLISWWRGEGSGLDHSANNDSSLVNQAGFAAARVGQGFTFDGNGDSARIGNPTNLWLQNFTIETWIKRASASAVTLYFDGSAQLFGCGSRGYNLAIDDAGKLFLGKVDINLVRSAGAITDTNWHHVAVTKSGSTVVFYIDGVANPTTTFDAVFEFPNSVAIGARPDTLGNSFLGMMDEVAFYGRALAGTEVQAIFGTQSSGKCVEIPPSILVQPTNQIVSVGDTAVFAALASGARPLSYQWLFNGTNIGGATLATLTLKNVQPAQAGDYSVWLTNAYGSVVSSNAALVVNAPPPCTAASPGLISWWRGEGDALDFVGNNSGIAASNVMHVVGKVGQAFSFNGVNQFVEVPHSASLNPTGSFSIEAWVFPTQDREGMIVCKWGDSGDYENNRSYQFTLHTGQSVGFHISDFANQWVSSFHAFQTTNGAVTLNAWNHVAGVYDQPSGTRRLYVNGVKVAERTHAPVPVYSGIAKLGIGVVFRSSTATASLFQGLIDEPTLVARALTDAEVQAIYSAQSSGKCAIPVAPFFTVQPTNQFVLAGKPVTLAAVAGGSPPFGYQWTLNGANLPGATTNTLYLPSASSANAGTYHLVVTNGSAVGAVTSAPALLDVRYALAYAGSTPLFGSNYTFNGSAVLTLTSVFPNANTFYTLDASAPGYASRYYSGPITVTRSSLLRFITYSADFLQSWEAPALAIHIIPTYPVTATTRGGGTVAVAPPTGPYLSNSTVTVTATPASGWTFLQWLGDVSVTNPSVQLTVNRPLRLEALFGTTLGTSVAGSGTLQVYPLLPFHPYGSVARLTAIPDAGNAFAVWGNAASGNVNPLAFPVTNATPTVSCLFAPLAPGQYALTALVDGFGRVTVNPRANTYAAQTSVTLTAIPEPGQDFAGWSGDATGAANPLVLTMDASKTITAHFTRRPTLAVDAVAEWLGTGGARLTLLGEVGAVYDVETSTNLADWGTAVTLTNTYGRVQFNDLTATNSPNQFYRARQSP